MAAGQAIGFPDSVRHQLRAASRVNTTWISVTTAAAAEPLFPDTNPLRLLPYGVPQYLIVGTRDNAWRVTITKNFATTAAGLGDNVEIVIPDGANHFDMVDAYGPVYPMIASAVLSMLGPDVMPKDGAARRSKE
jgi:hypothetical protein